MSQKNKSIQLGMPIQTASNRLRKTLLWKYIKLAGHNVCYRCGSNIDTEEDLSIEHKKPWLYSGKEKELYFNISNIAFSHLSCNKGSARKKLAHCGTRSAYMRGCRCEDCTHANTVWGRKYRNR